MTHPTGLQATSKGGRGCPRPPTPPNTLPWTGEVPQAGDQKQRVRQTGTCTNFGMPWNQTFFMR